MAEPIASSKPCNAGGPPECCLSTDDLLLREYHARMRVALKEAHELGMPERQPVQALARAIAAIEEVKSGSYAPRGPTRWHSQFEDPG